MKIELKEGDYGVSIEVIPETVQECGILLRLANNAKREKPDIYFSFNKSNAAPYASIWLKKLNPMKQINSISK